MSKIVFAYKGRYWVRDSRTLETLSSMAREAGHTTALAYDPDLFGVSDNVLSLPWLNRLLFDPRKTAVKAAASGADWIVLLENLANRPWIENFIKILNESHYKGRIAIVSYRGFASYRGEASIELLGEPESSFGAFLKVLPGAPPKTLKAEVLADLDALPLPDLDLFSAYEDFGTSYMAYAGKGCSGACSYCEEPFFRQACGPGYARLRRPARVIEELAAVKKRFKTREITFKDSVFTADKAWLKEFLAFYKAAIGVPFKCFGRSDAFDQETAVLLKDAGCYCVEFGLQTFNEKLRSSVLKRPETLEAVEKAFAACAAAGLPYDADYIFGLPGESAADHLEAARRFSEFRGLNRIKCHNLVYHKCLGITDYAIKSGFADETALETGDFFSGDRSAPAMRGADAAFRKLFKLYGLLGGALLGFAARWGLWRAFRFLPALLLKPLEFLAGLLRGDQRFSVYLKSYPLRILRFLLLSEKRCRKAVYAAVAVVLFLALLEIGSYLSLNFLDAVYEFHTIYSYMPPSVAQKYGKPMSNGGRIDPDLGWDFSPPVRGRDIKTSGKKYFVTAFGDSMTYAWEVEYDQSWAYLLGKKLGRDFLNFGVNGYGVDQSLLKFEKYSARFPSEYAILGILPADIGRLLMRMPNLRWRTEDPPFLKPRFKLTEKGLTLIPNPLKDISEYPRLMDPDYLSRVLREDGYYQYYKQCYGFDMAKGRRFPYTRELLRSLSGLIRYGGANRWWGNHPEEFYREGTESYALMKALVREFKERCAESGRVPIVLLHCDSRGDLYGTEYLDKFIRDVKDEGILLVNVRDLLLPEVLEGRVAIPMLLAPGGHYSPLANAIIAEKLAGFFSLLSRHEPGKAAVYYKTVTRASEAPR